MRNVRAEFHPAPSDEAGTEEWRAWAEGMPTSEVMGLSCVSVERGHVVVRMEASEWPLNPNGAVHGGMVLAWADHCFGLVAMTTLPGGSAPATAALSAQFLRPAQPPLTFDARVDRTGRTLAFVRVNVYDRRGRLATVVSGAMSNDGSAGSPPALTEG